MLPNKVDVTSLRKYERLVDGLWQSVEKRGIKNGDVFRVFNQNNQPDADGKVFLCLSELWYTTETKRWDIKAAPYSSHFFMGNYQRPKEVGNVEQEEAVG